MNTYNPTVHALVESLLEASSQITPHKKVGDGCSSRSIIIGGRSNKTGKGYVQYEIFGGGSGGRSGKDGVSGTNVNQSNAKIAPIEIIESEFATRVKRFELIPDSGGPGRFRGGLGFVREYEVLDNDARFSLRSTKHTVAPKGIDGGMDGKTGHCTLNPGKPEERVIPSRFSDHVLHPGEVFSLETPGGGGLGNALDTGSRARAQRRAQRLRHAEKSAGSLPRRHRRGGRRLCAERSADARIARTRLNEATGRTMER